MPTRIALATSATVYFVTLGGQAGYVLFSTTPTGRAAVGLTEGGMVRLLAPEDRPGGWRTLREWPSWAYSHTDLMLLLSALAEPRQAEDLLPSLPSQTLG